MYMVHQTLYDIYADRHHTPPPPTTTIARRRRPARSCRLQIQYCFTHRVLDTRSIAAYICFTGCLAPHVRTLNHILDGMQYHTRVAAVV